LCLELLKYNRWLFFCYYGDARHFLFVLLGIGFIHPSIDTVTLLHGSARFTRSLKTKLCSNVKQVVKVIWRKAASPPHMDGSVVFFRWRQCAPVTPYIESQKWLPWQHPLEPQNPLCLHRIAWPRKPTHRIKQRVAAYHTTKVIAHQKVKWGWHMATSLIGAGYRQYLHSVDDHSNPLRNQLPSQYRPHKAS